MTTKTVVVTAHAEKRMYERMGTKKDSLLKIARKAWRSRGKILPMNRILYSSQAYGNNRIVREFAGQVFVFKETPTEIVLLTVVNPRALPPG